MLDEQETLCINAIDDILWCGRTKCDGYWMYFCAMAFMIQAVNASQIFRRGIDTGKIIFVILPIIIFVISTILTDRRTKRMTHFKLLQESETVNWNIQRLVEQYFSSIRWCNVTYMFVAYYLLCPVLGYGFGLVDADNIGNLGHIIGGCILMFGCILAISVERSLRHNILGLSLRVLMKVLPSDTSVETFKDILKQLGYNISYDDVSWWGWGKY